MALPPAIDTVRHHPEMFVASPKFDCVVALLIGYDIALSGGFLIGFREWMVMRLDCGNNLAWPALIEDLLEREMISKDETKAINKLFALLDEFVSVRDSRDGVRGIFAGYERWLHRQVWYTPGHPSWLSPGSQLKPRRRRKKGGSRA